ncbi:hypothetical protein MY11210_008285 [Beauveria gryllotalpidicola]
MAGPNENQDSKAEDGAPAANAGNGVTPDLMALVAKSDIFQQILKVDIDNKRLRERNADLEVVNRTNWDTILGDRDAWKADKATLERELEDGRNEVKGLREAKTKADELSKQVQAQEKQILAQVETIKKKDSEIGRQESLCAKAKEQLEQEKASAKVVAHSLQEAKKNLARTKEELETVSEELAEFRSFTAPLQPMTNGKGQIQKALADTFNRFLEFFHAEFSVDIKTHVSTTGTPLEEHCINIPLPASNSAAAKQMRVAAALRVSGMYLQRHVFRHALVSYELDRALDAVALVNPDHEAFVRSVLLKLHKVAPEEQEEMQKDNVDSAVKEIAGTLGQIVPNVEGFHSRLQPLCEMAAEAWKPTAEMEGRIEAHIRFIESDDCRPVPFLEAESEPPANGANGQNSNNNKSAASPSKQPPSSPVQLSKGDLARVIWPLAMAHHFDGDGPEFEMMSCGYVLTKAQIQEAEEEVSREATPRKKARLESRLHNGEKKRRNSCATARGFNASSAD